MSDGNRRPVVLHVLEAVEGGTARHVIDLVRHARATRHHVAVPETRVGGVTDRDLVPAVRDAGGDAHLVEMRRNPVHPRNAGAAVGLRRLVRAVRPDVVHGHSAVGGALARLVAPRGTPTVYTPNGLRTDGPSLALERLLGRRTTRILAVSESEAEVVRAHHLVPDDRLLVIPNGIEPERGGDGRDLRALVGLAPGTPVVLMVGRLVAQKRPLDLVAAAALVHRRRPEVAFVLIGSGVLERPVDDAIAANDLGGTVRRLPSLPRAAGVLGQCEVVVQPSAFEGGPYVVLEAMREGAAVVVSDAVGNRDAVVDGESGVVVPVGDVDALAAAVLGLLDDPARRATLASAAQVRVRERFDVGAQGAAHDALYRELLTPRAR